MKWMYVKKALATALAVTLLAGTVEGISVQAEGMPNADEAVSEVTDEVMMELPGEVSDEEMLEQVLEIVPEEAELEVQEIENVAPTAETGVITGTCGASATYKFENGVLTISGTGKAEDAFYSFRSDIKKLVVEEGITEIPSFGVIGTGYVNLEEVSLPNSLTEMSSSAFRECSKLKEITIPSSVQKLNYFSFENCTSLTKVIAPGVKEIYNFSFYNCTNLKECKFADDVKISWRSFAGCKALVDKDGFIRIGNVLCGIDGAKTGKSVKLPEGITDVVMGAIRFDAIKKLSDGRAFVGSEFTSIYIPASMNCPEKEIGVDALKEGSLIDELLGVDTLETISVSAKNPWYTVVDGCLLNKNKTKLLLCPNAKKGSYKAPDTVETIGYAALSRCAYLTKATMPKSVKKVEYLGVATENYAPLYFEGNAPKAVPCIYMGDELSIFYSKYYDGEDFIKTLEEWKNNPSENTQNVYKFYVEEFAKLANWEIHYGEKSTGWDGLKKEYPRIKKWITDKVKATGVKLNHSEVDIKKGKTLTLKATVKPTNVSNKAVEWKSSNTKVAKVDKKTGKITAINYGTATITATTKDGSKKTAKCKVTVPYTIKYKLNKGTNSKKNPDGYYNEKVSFKSPTRKGYAFKGWYTDSKYKHKITSIKKGTKKNYTLYAKWEKVSAKATQITSAKNSKSKQLALKYKKVSGVKGYEISYTTDKTFKKSVVKKTTSKTSYTIKKLKKGKTYYVRVRTYKTDSAGKNVYSKDTKTLKIKIKK